MFRILKTLPLKVPQCSKYNYIHYPQCHADICFIKVTEKKDFSKKSLSESTLNQTVRIIMENPQIISSTQYLRNRHILIHVSSETK